MKYLCLVYINERDRESWEASPESKRNADLDEIFSYDAELRKGGFLLGGDGLQSPKNAASIRYQNGKLFVTDGPFVETKEQLMGYLMLEAKDLNHAIQLMSNHPMVKAGGFEIRPILDATTMVQADKERRRSAAKE
jgi:hypothetical protein